MIDSMYNFFISSWKKLKDELDNNVESMKEDQTIIRYSDSYDGANMTTLKNINSKYIGICTVPKALYGSRNLAKHTHYENNNIPPFIATSSTMNTAIEEGFKCVKVQTSTSGSGLSGIYYRNSDLYTQFTDGDDITVSFLIKGDVGTWGSLKFGYAVEIGVVNQKTSYADWERVIWYGKNRILGEENIGSFSIESNISTTQQTFFIRDFCVQKTSAFKAYTVAPEDIINDPNQYTWSLIDVKQTDWEEDDSSSQAFLKNKPVSLPASDVSSWAKAPTKPNYTYSEITNKPVNVSITVDEFGWSENLPYTKTISVPGIKATDEPIIFPYTPHNVSGSVIDTTRQMASYITDADTAEGELIIYCGKTKPTSSFDILVVGISPA